MNGIEHTEGDVTQLEKDSLEESEAVVLRTLENVLHDLEGSRSTPEQLLEALLFSTHMPLSEEEIGQALRMDAHAVEHTLSVLESVLAERPTPLGIFTRAKGGAKQGGRLGYILDVRAGYRRSIPIGRPTLSQSATETLALIALNQPISQSRLVRERGSTVYEHVKEFLQKGWLIRTKKGRSYELRTSEAFAAEFGLQNDADLIKRALARAAGEQRQPEVVGSPRVHFDAQAEGAPDLLAEALASVPPERPPFVATAPLEVQLEKLEDCLVSGGEPPVTAGPAPVAIAPTPVALPAPRAEDDCLVSGGEPPTEAVTAAAAPAPVAMPAPKAEDDCLISGGEPPTPTEIHPKEVKMSENTTPDHPEPVVKSEPLSDTANFKRASKLFGLLGDDSATDDDW